MKHTAGPWVWRQDYEGLFDAGSNNDVLSYDQYEGMWLSHGHADANARLIAAAPELLKQLNEQMCPACKGYLGDPKPDPEIDCYCDEARAVIAKATGETK